MRRYHAHPLDRLLAQFDMSGALERKRGGQIIKQMLPGTILQVYTDWPSDFGNGKPLTVTVAGQPVQIRLHKMVDF